MKSLNDLNTPNIKLAKKFIETLDEILNVYINIFDDVFVSGVKDGKVVYREFKQWK